VKRPPAHSKLPILAAASAGKKAPAEPSMQQAFEFVNLVVDRGNAAAPDL
jgi:hypothetical protein